MSSPIIEQVRTIPLIVEKDYAHNRDNLIPMEDDEIDEISGFPFDDDFDRRDRDGNFRSQLDDIAQRHPEFAEHLTSFRNREPAGHAPSAHHHPFYQRSGYADRPFGTRFDRYFPFDVEPEEYRQFYQSRPEYYPEYHQQAQAQPQQANPAPAAEEAKNPEKSEVNPPEQEQKAQPEQNTSINEKGRNLQQSNTVDLGKGQEPVDDRQQRSMSAPPPENRPRFRSHINIPINRDVGAENSQQSQQPQPQQSQQQQPQQSQQQSRPTERVIPIHVEGRDEPVIPRNVHQTFTSAPPPPQYQHHNPQPQQQRQQPQTERIFGQRPEMFTQFVSPGFGRPNDDIFRQQQQQYQREQEQKYRQQQEELARQQQQAQQHQQHQQQQPPNQNQNPPESPRSASSTPIDQIKAIQKDVSDLMNQVEQFGGALRDKQYLYLEEMLTRQILKLDDIDAQGQENIRSARKDSIRCIEATLSLLESKAKANDAKNAQKAEEKMEVEPAAQSTTETEQKSETMETDPVSNEKVVADNMEVAPAVPEENRAVLVMDNNEKAAPAATDESQSEKKEEAAQDAEKPPEAENKETETSDKKEKKKTKKKAADKK